MRLGRLPLIGHALAFHADSAGFLLGIAREQGDVARFRLGRIEAFLLSHPDGVRGVLVDRAADFGKGRLMQRARRLLGDGLLTSEGATHRRQRRRVQPVFARERRHAYGALIPELVSRHVASWSHGGRVRLDAEMNALAMKVVARALLGVDIEHEVPALGKALHRLTRWAPLLAAPGGRALEQARLPVVRLLREAIETIEAAIDRQIAQGADEAPLLEALLHSAAELPMSKGLVRDEVMTIFLAGHDTTAAALIWIWLLLGSNPGVESRLHGEMSSVLAGRRPRMEDLEKMPYAGMVVKETLRLYPPISRIGRRPLEDVTLGSVTLPRNAPVFLSPFVTQRDPRWFTNPEEFQPERWAAPAADRPRFAWFPFGAGPRSCVGEHFALGVLTLALVTIAQEWRLVPTAGLPRRRSFLTLKPRGAVWMTAEAR